MKRISKQLVLVSAVFFWFSNAHAQTPLQSSQKFGKHISITALLSPAGKGPANIMKEAMQTSGFGHTSPRDCVLIFCFPERDYPNSSLGISWRGKITYHINPNYGIALLYSESDFGSISGYNNSVGRLSIEHRLNSVSPQLAVGIYDIISINAGPALNVLKVRNKDNDTFRTSRKLGADLNLNFRIPKKSLFFVTIDIHYKWAGSYSIGPYTKISGDTMEIFKETKVNYNILTIGYGFGIRL